MCVESKQLTFKNIVIYEFDFRCSVIKSFFPLLAKYLWHEKWNGVYHYFDASEVY